MRYTEAEARAAIGASTSWAETMRRLGMCPTGGGPRTLRAWAGRWGISWAHFDPYATSRGRRSPARRPLESLLVKGSRASRSTVKARLYEEGVKERRCEHCGQGEEWRGARLALILDHVNGVSDDNRLENLRILCPNCAATLDTHCGRHLRREPGERPCAACGAPFRPSRPQQRYCGRACGTAASGRDRRRVERPPLDALRAEVERDGFSAVGRRLGVSDNAVRKWLRSTGVEVPRRRGPGTGVTRQTGGTAAGHGGTRGDGAPD